MTPWRSITPPSPKDSPALGLLYRHIAGHSAMGSPQVPDSVKQTMRQLLQGAITLSGGYDAARAQGDIDAGMGDLVAVGREFLANPALPARWRSGAVLNKPDFDTFCSPGPKGYTDYPAT